MRYPHRETTAPDVIKRGFARQAPDIDIVIGDVDEVAASASAGVLTNSPRQQKGGADATLTTTWRSLPTRAMGRPSTDGLVDAGIEYSGDATVLARLAAVLNPGDESFALSHPDAQAKRPHASHFSVSSDSSCVPAMLCPHTGFEERNCMILRHGHRTTSSVASRTAASLASMR